MSARRASAAADDAAEAQAARAAAEAKREEERAEAERKNIRGAAVDRARAAAEARLASGDSPVDPGLARDAVSKAIESYRLEEQLRKSAARQRHEHEEARKKLEDEETPRLTPRAPRVMQ